MPLTPQQILEDAILVAERQHKAENDPTSKFWGFRLYADAAASSFADLLGEIDEDRARDDGDPFNAGWHAAVAEIRERLGLAS